MPDYERCPRFNNPNIDCCGRGHKEDRQKISEIEATVDFQNERVVMPRYHLSAVRNAPFYWTTYVRLYSELEKLEEDLNLHSELSLRDLTTVATISTPKLLDCLFKRSEGPM